MKYAFTFALLAVCFMADAEEVYNNPVDGKKYIADWKQYLPEGPVVEQKGRVINNGVRLLTAETEIGNNVSVNELVSLIKKIEETLVRETNPYKESGELMVQVALSKESNPVFTIAFQGKLNEKLLQSIYEKLKLIKLNTKRKPFSLQVQFIIKAA
jgi:hypothetical protein